MSREIETSDAIAAEAVFVAQQRERQAVAQVDGLLREVFSQPGGELLHVDEARRRGIIGYAGELRGTR